MKAAFQHKISQRIAVLAKRRADLEARIRQEMKRPMPCTFTLRHLKKMKLSLKDRIEEARWMMGQSKSPSSA